MILHVESDDVYLVDTKSRSRGVVYFHYLDHYKMTKYLEINDTILVECKTLIALFPLLPKLKLLAYFIMPKCLYLSYTSFMFHIILNIPHL